MMSTGPEVEALTPIEEGTDAIVCRQGSALRAVLRSGVDDPNTCDDVF